MASTTAAVAAGSSATLVATSVMECRSSSSVAFGSVRFAPVVKRSGACKVNATVRASQNSEEPKAARREVLTGLLAAGVFITSAPAYALTGPGGDGAASTAKKADKLLNEADKLTESDSPQRFSEGVKEGGSTAKQAGSAAAENVKDVADAAVTNARENLNKAKESFGDIMGKNKVSDASSAFNKTFEVSDASDVVNDVKDNAKSAVGDAKGNASNAADDAKGFLSSLGDKLTGNNPSDIASDVQGKASKAVGDAQSKINLPNKKTGQNF